MKDSTLRIIRQSLIGQKNAKNRILDGYARTAENREKDIAKYRAQIQEAQDQIRQCKEEIKSLQEDIAGIVDAYHEFWDEDPADDPLEGMK